MSEHELNADRATSSPGPEVPGRDVVDGPGTAVPASAPDGAVPPEPAGVPAASVAGDGVGPLATGSPLTDAVEPADFPVEPLEPLRTEEEDDYEQLLEDLQRLHAEREDYLDQLLRTRADFENYRKRMLRQQGETLERAGEELVLKLLEVLDVFDAAVVHGQGFDQAYARLVAVLTKEGLARIEPVGAPFDPTEADAVHHEAGEDGPVVSEVLRPGYRWKGRVLRPAMVKVKG
jgi:molecular chaperone GrpE